MAYFFYEEIKNAFVLQDVGKSGLDFSDTQQLWLYFHASYIFVAKFIEYIIVCSDILAKIYLDERRKVEMIRDSFQAKGPVIRETSGGTHCTQVPH